LKILVFDKKILFALLSMSKDYKDNSSQFHGYLFIHSVRAGNVQQYAVGPVSSILRRALLSHTDRPIACVYGQVRRASPENASV